MISEPDARQLLMLAAEYHRASKHLSSLGQKGRPSTRAPSRLTAIHAVELYLSALLIARGFEAKAVRAMGHDLGKRAVEAEAMGLKLRKRTRDHLSRLSDEQDYLNMRYRPDRIQAASPNRLDATLREVADKVVRLMSRDALAAQPNSASKLARRAA